MKIIWLSLAEARVQLSEADYQHLADDSSLTRRVRERCDGQFSVQLIGQQTRQAEEEARDLLALPEKVSVLSRKVFLSCDGRPCIFAKTLIALTPENEALTGQVMALGEDSLGSILFRDPQAIKKQMHLALMPTHHGFFARANLTTRAADDLIWVRRSLFQYDGRDLIVYEAFIDFSAN